MPRDDAEIYTLTFSIPDLIRREVKLNEKDDSISGSVNPGRFCIPTIHWKLHRQLHKIKALKIYRLPMEMCDKNSPEFCDSFLMAGGRKCCRL
jgi:hypothetical protein